MTLNKIFRKKMQHDHIYDTVYHLYGAKNPDKKIDRRIARKRMKQDKFYNGFYEFIEFNRKKNEK